MYLHSSTQHSARTCLLVHLLPLLQLTCLGGLSCGLYVDQVMVADAYTANTNTRSGCLRLKPNTTHDLTLRFFAPASVLASNETKMLLRWAPCAALWQMDGACFY